MNYLDNISISFPTISDNKLTSLLLHGDVMFDDTKNRKKLMSTIRFIIDLQLFEDQVFRF